MQNSFFEDCPSPSKPPAAANKQNEGKEEKFRKMLKDKRYRHRWRTDMLAIPRGHQEILDQFRRTKKPEEPEMDPEQLERLKRRKAEALLKRRAEIEVERQKRLKELCKLPPRVYKVNKALYAPVRGKAFAEKMDEQIKAADNSIYHEWSRAKINWQKSQKKAKKPKKPKGKKGKAGAKGSKGKPKKLTHEQRLKETLAWCVKNSKPKPVFKPKPLKKGKIADLAKMGPRIDVISKPKFPYIKPSDDPNNVENMGKISPAALHYQATERVQILARPNPNLQPVSSIDFTESGVVARALIYKPTERILELAIPKARSAKIDSDYKEDAYTISKAALKYVASPRIIEISKPVERD